MKCLDCLRLYKNCCHFIIRCFDRFRYLIWTHSKAIALNYLGCIILFPFTLVISSSTADAIPAPYYH